MKRRRNNSAPYIRRQRRRYQRPVARQRTRSLNARVGGFLGIEKKFVDYGYAETAMSTSWALAVPATTSLSTVAQGDGESNRDGRGYVIDSIQIKGYIKTGPTENLANPEVANMVRIALVWDKQTNGALPTAANIMNDGTGESWTGYRNLEYVKRFQVLKEKTFKHNLSTLASNAATNDYSSGGRITPFKMSYTFKRPLNVNTSGTTADIANIVDNSLHLIATSGVASALAYTSRLRFKG